MTTDDAYVGAQKVLITPTTSPARSRSGGEEGQQFPGHVLFEIDRCRSACAVAQAKATIARHKVTTTISASDLKIYGR